MAYPGSLDTFTTKVDYVDLVLAAHVNDLQAAVVAIETALGIAPTTINESSTPDGTVVSVAEALDDYATILKNIIGSAHYYSAVPASLTTFYSRSITAGAGLTGGGTLGADRTIALATPGSLTITSANSATAPHTHAVTSSSNPGAAAALLASNGAGGLTLASLATGSGGITMAHGSVLGGPGTLTVNNLGSLIVNPGIDLRLYPVGQITVDPGSNVMAPANTLDVALGSITKRWSALYAGDLIVGNLVRLDTSVVMNGRLLIGSSSSLIADAAPADATIDVATNPFVANDVVYLESEGKMEFMQITSAATPITGGYRYSVTRGYGGVLTAKQYYTGDIVFNTGQAGKGWLEEYAYSGIKSGQVGPTILANVRNSTTFNDWIEHAAFGNLNGVYGYTGDIFGIAAGKYATGNPWIGVDTTNGVRIMRYTTQLAKWDTSGNILLGQTGAGQSNVYMSSGAVTLRNNTTAVVSLLATANANGQIATFDGAIGISTSGGIYQGTGTFAIPTTGLKFWNDSGVGRIAGYASGALQWYANTSGQLMAGAGHVILDATGITFSDASGTYTDDTALKFKRSTGEQIGALYAFNNSSSNIVELDTQSYAGQDSKLFLISTSPSGKTASVTIQSLIAGGYKAELALQTTIAKSTLSTPNGLAVGYALGSIPAGLGDGDLYTSDDLTVEGGDITIGADTNLYRSAADVLTTDDAFSILGPYLAVVGTAPYINLYNTEDKTWSVGDILSDIRFYGSDTSGNFPAVAAKIACYTGTTFGAHTGLTFYANNDAASPTERARLSFYGNWLVGTTTDDTAESGWIRTAKVAMTPGGGIAILATAGENLTAGEVVSVSTSTSERVMKAAANSDMPLGAVYATATSGNPVWVVVSGFAEVTFKSGVTPTRGDIAYMSDTAGQADASATLPSVTLHNREIGHVYKTGTSGGTTTCILHFN